MNVVTSGDIPYPLGGRFYGYENSNKGPGSEAFANALKCALDHKVMMFIVWGKDACATCSAFVTELNEWGRATPTMLAKGATVNAYFRGRSDGTGPSACVDCYNFLVNTVGASGNCHIMAAYGVFEDGTVYRQSCSLPTTFNAISARKYAWVNEYEALAMKHKRKATSAFACGHMDMADVKTLYVPFVRTDNTSEIERNGLKVVAGDGTTSVTNFTWQKEQTQLEIPVSFAGDTNTTWKLILLNSNGQEVATNGLTRHTGTLANSFYNPRFIGEMTNGYAFGEWTLDFAAATNAVAAGKGKAYTLAVSGSSTTDPKLYAFEREIFTSTNFMNWATDNNVALVLLDRPISGNSILNHTHDYDDNCYVSLKGLRAFADTVPAEGDAVKLSAEEMMGILAGWNRDYRKDAGSEETEYILIRADGTVVGHLSPYLAEGEWFVEENMQRLNDLLALAADETESANDDPAKTPLTIVYGKQASANDAQTLMISDTVDAFALTGVPANTPFKVGYEKLQTSSVEPTLAVCAWNGPEKKGYTTLSSNMSPNIYVATEAQVRNGLFVTATAWTNDVAQTKAFGAITWVLYAPTALPAPEDRGEIGFGGDPEQKYVIEGADEKVEIVVKRTGFTGAATATVRLDRSNTQVPESYLPWLESWEGDATNVTWAANESGEKSIWVTVKQDVTGTWGESFSNLAFTVEAQGAEPAAAATNLVIGISQLLDPDTPAGTVAIEGTTSDSTVYVYGGALGSQRDPFVLGIRRCRAYYEARDAWTAYGVVTATVSAVGCTFDPATVVWPSGEGTAAATPVGVVFPDVDRQFSYKNVTLTLTARDFNGKDITDYGNNTLTVCVLPSDSRGFASDISCPDAVQHVAISAFSLLQDWAPDQDLEVVGVKRISGELPPGVSATADAAVAALRVSGTPTKTGTYESRWWMTLRRKGDKSKLMTKPCKVTITVKPLAYDPKTGEGMIPGFDQARSWTGLPLVDNETKRLAGLLDMTVAKNGRTTAKWRKAGGKVVSFSAASLSGALQDEERGTNVFANAQKTQGTVANEFAVRFWADGSIKGDVVERDGEGAVATLAAFVVPAAETWSKDRTAEDWEGDYTLAFPHDGEVSWHTNTLCTGAATLRVKFDTASQFKTGKATFAGYLPNGRSVSGTAAFVPAAKGTVKAELPIFYSTVADTFGALLDVGAADATERVPPVATSATATNFWQHVESGVEAASYDNDYAVVGTRYEAENWETAWKADYGTNALCFAVDGEDVGIRIAAKGTTLKVADKGELKALSFSLNRASGVAAGSFRDATERVPPVADGKTATWRGVAIPGGEAFMTGAYWHTKAFEYQTEKGAKTCTIKVGGAVALEPER